MFSKNITIDKILRGKISIIQLKKGFRYGFEAVFLAAFVNGFLKKFKKFVGSPRKLQKDFRNRSKTRDTSSLGETLKAFVALFFIFGPPLAFFASLVHFVACSGIGDPSQESPRR